MEINTDLSPIPWNIPTSCFFPEDGQYSPGPQQNCCLPHCGNGMLWAFIKSVLLSLSRWIWVLGSRFTIAVPTSCWIGVQGSLIEQHNKRLGWKLLQGASMFTELSSNFFWHFSIRVLGNHRFSHERKHSELKYAWNEKECLIWDTEIPFIVRRWCFIWLCWKMGCFTQVKLVGSQVFPSQLWNYF